MNGEEDPLIPTAAAANEASQQAASSASAAADSASSVKGNPGASRPSILARIKTAILYTITFIARLIIREPKRVTVESVDVHVRNLPDNLSGLRIAFLSDFHFNRTDHYMRRVRAELLDDIVTKTTALHPDIILLGGDYIDWDGHDIDLFSQNWGRLLSQIPRYGTYGVIGNHDQFLSDSKERIVASLESIGVRVLDNTTVVPVPGLAVIGLGDWGTPGDFRPDIAVPASLNESDACRVLLTHNPDCMESLGDMKADLQLCGHTHGGQIRLPWIGPLIPFMVDKLKLGVCSKALRRKYNAVKNWEWAAGMHTIENKGYLNRDKTLYVTRGIGTHPPIRLFCAPELTLITLKK